jgi:UDP-N-acetylmuramate--alanine ligase
VIKPDLTLTVPDTLGTVHFVGIGGSGMSGIARLFLAAGHTVTGSDVRDSDNIHALRALGARIHIGHDAANVGDADSLVVTGALWQDNPEYVLANERGLPVLHRSQALAWLIRSHRLVSVAGAHGKTTSTGMIVTGLLGIGQDPSFVNGGVIESLGVSAGSGADDRHQHRPDHQRRPGSPRSLRLARSLRGRFRRVRPERRRTRRGLRRRPRRRARERAPHRQVGHHVR